MRQTLRVIAGIGAISYVTANLRRERVAGHSTAMRYFAMRYLDEQVLGLLTVFATMVTVLGLLWLIR